MIDMTYDIQSMAVIGVGIMGSGIAQIAAQSGHTTYLYDTKEGAALQAKEKLAATFQKLVDKNKISAEQAENANKHLIVAAQLEDLKACDLIVEAIVERLDIKQAYIGGLSLGGYVSLAFGIAHPEMSKGLILAATGAGAFFDKNKRKEWERIYENNAQRIETKGLEAVKDEYANEAKRIQLRHKDPKGWRKYYEAFARHSSIGSAHTIRRFIIPRPTIFELEPKLKQIKVPTLILTGDEDDPCIEPGLFMKRNIAHSGLVVFPQSGHTINVEEPELFNWAMLDFLTSVNAESWA